MAHGNNIEYICERITEDEIRNFAIYDTDKKTLIEENKTGTLSPEEVCQRVRRTLSNCHGLVYGELARKSREEAGKGGKVLENARLAIQCGGANAPVHGIGNTGPSQDYIGALNNNFQLQLDNLKAVWAKDQEIQNLKAKIKELEEGNPMVKMMEPHLPRLIDGIFGASPQRIAGPGPDAPQQEEVKLPENAEKFAELQLRRLLAVDPEFLSVLERLADMAETNRAMYDMAKNMLPKTN
jgi:hypothetical protein